VSGNVQQLATLPGAVWVHGSLMALISTVLPIYWMALAIQRMGATHAAAFGNLGPVLTVFASWALLGEAITVYQVAGLALVLFGVSRLSGAKAAPQPAPKQQAEDCKATG
jgi:drug/metabolite transporter (DMT)-like permease